MKFDNQNEILNSLKTKEINSLSNRELNKSIKGKLKQEN